MKREENIDLYGGDESGVRRMKNNKKKPSKITVSDVALVVSILTLIIQMLCHVIIPITNG